jgi:hypothetical protein
MAKSSARNVEAAAARRNLEADLASDAIFLNNKVHDGQIAQAGGFMAAMQAKQTSRDLKSRSSCEEPGDT